MRDEIGTIFWVAVGFAARYASPRAKGEFMRKISVLGDSISTFENTCAEGYRVYYDAERQQASGVSDARLTWWGLVIERLGGQLLANASWSGSMVEGVGFPAGQSNERAQALGRDGEVPDDVLVYYGTNDYGWGSARAQAAARGGAVPFCLEREGLLPPVEEPSLAPEDAAETFGGAYAQMLRNVRSAFPNARVWCFTIAPGRVKDAPASTFPRTYRGVAFEAYNQAILRAASTEGCIGCDMDALGYDYEGMEGTHPTALGMRQLAWMALSCMADAGEDVGDLGPYPGGEAFANFDPCDELGRACVGCPYALSTGSKWMHVCTR